ncbi:GNAT family N-acetyltransferase [Planococcus halotolerans]|uniref:N-acetyltransferase n=1 Tax=Planococcus halotolerans TaxID=2233542 RepID=A0A365KRZ5_9BACL|nr:GNAT family N-acetyltransferase [Planococcus halotolerans]QHJ69604.1 GNAT family N-acetyltransferase [Planococcus halotolerans]RAZ75552.1 N-acetyltransferase [Planococcus halotolerans]
MKLETERLIISPCTEDVIALLNEQHYENGPQVSNHLKQLAEDPAILYWGPWLAMLKADNKVIGDLGFKGAPDNKVIGDLGFKGAPDNKGAVEIGYGLLEEYRGKGYATEAVAALVDWAWKQNGIHKVKAETLVDNQESIRVLEKLGMRKVAESEEMVYWEITGG